MAIPLILLSLLVMALVAYTQIRGGMVNAFGTCFATVVSGMLAFEFWPNLAFELAIINDFLPLDGMEDALALTLVFCICVVVLRIGIGSMTRDDFGFSPKVDQVGAGVFGLVTGFLVSGFLMCVLQTLPWHEHFLGFEYEEEGLSERVLPADQVWLKLMLRANRGAFSTGEDQSKLYTEFCKNFGHDRRYNEERARREGEKAKLKQKEAEAKEKETKEKDKKDSKDKKGDPKENKDKKGDPKENK